jgi:TonB family protein
LSRAWDLRILSACRHYGFRDTLCLNIVKSGRSRVKSQLGALGAILLFATSTALAADDEAKMKRDAKNWEVLHSMYPKRALAAREEGLVGFIVKIDAAGSPTSCQVTHTSGHQLLDQETCQLIMVHANFKRPEGISLSQQRSYEGVVNWKLPSTPLAAVPAAPKAIDVAAAPEKMICKRTLKTGSNAAFERTCMTPSQWQKASEQTQDWWREQGKRGFSCGGDGTCPDSGR